MRGHAALLLAALLVGCGGTPDREPEATLTAVLPSPVTPGEDVVAYGLLPTGTAVTLGGRPVPSVSVPGGLRVTVPADTLAGLHELRVKTKAELTGSVQVVPRIDGAAFSGGRVRTWGAGWGQGVDAHLEVNGSALPTTRNGPDLSAALPDPGVYGSLTIRAVVKDHVSKPFTLDRAAASASGSVTLPAAGQAGPLRATAVRPPRPTRALLVRGRPSEPQPPGLERSEPLPGLDVTRLTYGSVAQAQAASTRLAQDPGVVFVAFDSTVHTDGGQSVPLAAGSPADAQWFWVRQGFPNTWTRTLGEGVTVAVVDTGVLLTHPDLQANLLPGRDFVEDDDQPLDTNGHGTHVAGLIAARGQVTGAAPGAKLLPVRVLSGEEGGSVADVAAGILWAANLLKGQPNPHPAQVINLSLGTDEFNPVLAEAVARVQAAGALVVAATGNDGGRPLYPAGLPNVLAVTALAGPSVPYQPSYASRGPGTRLTAYGGDLGTDQDKDGEMDGILSTDLVRGAPGHALRMGTSMAAPQVSGAAALALSAGVKPIWLRATLERRASDLGVRGFDESYGWGLLSADAARTGTPRVYVVALNQAGQVAAFSPSVDGTYRLANVPPNEPVRLLAVTDGDDDGLLGEAGDLRSAARELTLQAAQNVALDFSLAPTDGAQPITLGGTP